MKAGPAKRPLALLTGITGDLAFAAGCMLLAVKRHCTGVQPDVFVFHDAALSAGDTELLRRLGAETVLYEAPEANLRSQVVAQFSFISLARFEGFRFLKRYRSVIWLDADTVVQDDIGALASYGPLAMAPEDPWYNEDRRMNTADHNMDGPVHGFDGTKCNFNSGVMVLRDDLPEPQAAYGFCLAWLRSHAAVLKFPDQAVLNMLAQQLERRDPALVDRIPCDRFNCHPRNPNAKYAAVAHMFGPFKTWYDGLTRCSFPEWDRDYKRWVDMGGSPWRGPVTNAEYFEGGAFHMLDKLVRVMDSAEKSIDGLRRELAREKRARSALEKALSALQGSETRNGSQP